MDEAAIQAAAIEKRRKRIEIGGELNVPKLSAYVRLERNAWAARERKKAKAAEAKAGGETMPPDVEEAVARAGCTQDAPRTRLRLPFSVCHTAQDVGGLGTANCIYVGARGP